MFLWLDSMEYDPQNGNFPKMNLNENDSGIFVKRVTLTLRTAMGFNYSFIIFFGIMSCISAYLHENQCFFQYFISILLFDYQSSYMVNHVYGLMIFSYQLFYYFQLKFRNINAQAKPLLNSNKNLNPNLNFRRFKNQNFNKLNSDAVFKLIKQHNHICLMLNQLNQFWKYLLTIQMCFYAILTWLLVYVHFFYPNLDFFIKIILFSLMILSTYPLLINSYKYTC